ncbi:MAG: heat-inducible transcription repressor HrcA [Gemmatimonadetes bacterium]|nr:heat-inducible transcription repressor HrcA [Gemmatimonadota bacterium]
MPNIELSDRERKVLEAVIESYVVTAEPAGSRTIARKFPLGVSAATVRNTMSDLEDRGYLYHPHTSAGRVPTDLAYRMYVDQLVPRPAIAQNEVETLRRELRGEYTPIDALLLKAAQVLGVLTQELGIAVGPSLDTAVLERLELIQVSSDRLLLVFALSGGVARTIFVEVSNALPREAVASVGIVLNDRLSGLTLREVRATLRDRLRDSGTSSGEVELLNIFIEEADHLFDQPATDGDQVLLSSAQMLAEQPEFASNEQMRNLLELTERRDLLRRALKARPLGGLTVSIGGENMDPRLSAFTIVTSTYRQGELEGVIGVMGPTRMPYQKIVALVEHTSQLMGELLK